jgi:predicted small lipoprotein YifL
MHSAPSITLGLAALLSLAGCGARTELRVPDAGSDGSLDAAAPKGVSARDCDDGLACTDDRCVAGRCARATVDARCNDNVYCNGVERCVAGVG